MTSTTPKIAADLDAMLIVARAIEASAEIDLARVMLSTDRVNPDALMAAAYEHLSASVATDFMEQVAMRAQWDGTTPANERVRAYCIRTLERGVVESNGVHLSTEIAKDRARRNVASAVLRFINSQEG